METDRTPVAKTGIAGIAGYIAQAAGLGEPLGGTRGKIALHVKAIGLSTSGCKLRLSD
jgi:hypothetical protein